MRKCSSCGCRLQFLQSFELPDTFQQLDWETLLSDDLCANCFQHWMHCLGSLSPDCPRSAFSATSST